MTTGIPTVGTVFYFLDTEGNVVGACQRERKDAVTTS